MVMVTHDNYLASFGDKVIHIRDGKIIKVEEHPGGAVMNPESMSADGFPGGTLAVPGGALAMSGITARTDAQQTVQSYAPQPDIAQTQLTAAAQMPAAATQTVSEDMVHARQMVAQAALTDIVQTETVMSGGIPERQQATVPGEEIR